MRPHPKPSAEDREQLTSADIVMALSRRAKRYGQMVFTEVCCGRAPGWFHRRGDPGARRIDLLTIPRSWSNIEVVAYEIKVSRSDFLADDKWQFYLDWCSRLFFAAPVGVITAKDMEDRPGAGLVQFEPCMSATKWTYGIGRKRVDLTWREKVERGRLKTAVQAEKRPLPNGHIPIDLYHTLLLNKVGG